MYNKTSLLTLIAVTGFSASSLANIQLDNQCDVNLNGEVNYHKGTLTLTTPQQETVVISPSYEVSVDGKNIALTNQQQQWITEYHQNIEKAIPMTVNLAVEGIEIASYAINEAFGALIGSDDELITEFNEFFDSLSEEIGQHFETDEHSYSFNSGNIEGSDWIGDKWEREFEEKTEELVSRSMGKILVSLGSELMFGDGDMEEFAEKMENVETEIETKVEEKALVLEKDAEALCELLTQTDALESQLQASVTQLNHLDIVDLDSSKYEPKLK